MNIMKNQIFIFNKEYCQKNQTRKSKRNSNNKFNEKKNNIKKMILKE